MGVPKTIEGLWDRCIWEVGRGSWQRDVFEGVSTGGLGVWGVGCNTEMIETVE